MYRLLKPLLLVLCLVLAWKWWQGRAPGADPAWAQPSPSGFVHAAMPDGARRNTVLVLAPLNCPSDAAQRADALARGLEQQGIRVNRGDSFSLHVPDPSAQEKENIDRAVQIINGAVPAVFVNGMGKANPTLDEVVAEFERTRT